jgi:hypothetical protein
MSSAPRSTGAAELREHQNRSGVQVKSGRVSAQRRSTDAQAGTHLFRRGHNDDLAARFRTGFIPRPREHDPSRRLTLSLCLLRIGTWLRNDIERA